MLSKKSLEYLGIQAPESVKQVRVEILGLKHLVRQAEERIARLEQALAVAELQKEQNAREKDTTEASDSKTETSSNEGTSVPGQM